MEGAKRLNFYNETTNQCYEDAWKKKMDWDSLFLFWKTFKEGRTLNWEFPSACAPISSLHECEVNLCNQTACKGSGRIPPVHKLQWTMISPLEAYYVDNKGSLGDAQDDPHLNSNNISGWGSQLVIQPIWDDCYPFWILKRNSFLYLVNLIWGSFQISTHIPHHQNTSHRTGPEMTVLPPLPHLQNILYKVTGWKGVGCKHV